MKLAFEPKEISKVRESLHRPIDAVEEGVEHIRALSSNVIVPVSSKMDLETIQEMLTKMMRAVPGRYFLIQFKEELTELKAQTTYFCIPRSKAETVCSDIVKLSAGFKNDSELFSLLRACLLPGVSTRTFYLDPEVRKSVLIKSIELSEWLFLYSPSLGNQFDSLTELTQLGANVVDLGWLETGSWRDVIRDVFEDSRLLEQLPLLEQLRLSLLKESESKNRIVGLLLAGWIVARLGGEVLGCSPSGFECGLPGEKKLEICLDVSEQSGRGLDQVSFCFTDPEKGAGKEAVQISIGGEDLIARVTLDHCYEVRGPNKSNELGELIRRYFEVGESTLNYEQALTSASEMFRLYSQVGSFMRMGSS